MIYYSENLLHPRIELNVQSNIIMCAAQSAGIGKYMATDYLLRCTELVERFSE